MTQSESGQSSASIHARLGLPTAAEPEELAAAYVRLRAHVEARALASRDPAFSGARRTELADLDRAARSAGLGDGHARGRSGAARAGTRIARAAVAAGLLAALGAAAWLWRPPGAAVSAAPPQPAQLLVDADPAGAGLEVLDAAQEHVVLRAPADGSPQLLEAGVYRLRVTHEACPEVWEREQRLDAGQSREYAPDLCRGSGRLVIRSNVSEDRVRIDGVDVGSTGALAHTLRVGAHDVSVQKQGYETWSGRVVIQPDQELTLHAELSPDRPATPEREAGPGSAPAPAPRAAAGPAPAPAAPTDAAGGPTPGPGPAGERLLRTGKGGSKSWHDAVRERLVASYDRNGSRSLDTPEEVNSISCEVWREIEQSYETGGLSVDMARLYGFDGSDAPANTLGITGEMRGYAYDRMVQCGLKTRI